MNVKDNEQSTSESNLNNNSNIKKINNTINNNSKDSSSKTEAIKNNIESDVNSNNDDYNSGNDTNTKSKSFDSTVNYIKDGQLALVSLFEVVKKKVMLIFQKVKVFLIRTFNSFKDVFSNPTETIEV